MNWGASVIQVTKPAALVCNAAQWDAIVQQLGEDRCMFIYTDIGLPTGYVGFDRYTQHNGEWHVINGGIDTDGRIST